MSKKKKDKKKGLAPVIRMITKDHDIYPLRFTGEGRKRDNNEVAEIGHFAMRLISKYKDFPIISAQKNQEFIELLKQDNHFEARNYEHLISTLILKSGLVIPQPNRKLN